ncbi:alpha/beta fold hydrolase [Aquisediminimonas sediminicola]|uniref:alpha/beta fold hydrolase n=1 Tax=Alteraquisediminimonas sediminicola TaxID=2676787 RepID=UPI001C8EEAE4|nr:alpha/beta hydrolase [Aquisediminimonas sediminicola]
MTQIVLIPGLMNDGWVWRHQIAALSRLGPLHIACNDGCDHLADMAARILEATNGPLALVGHSMGGRVALEVAALAPERVTRLAMVASGAQGLGLNEADGRMRLVQIAQNSGMAAVADAWMPDMVGTAGRDNPGLMAGLKAMLCRVAVDDFAAQQHALIHRSDRMDLLAQMHIPTLFISGSEDHSSSTSFNQQMAQMSANGLSVELPHAGHMLPIEAPTALTDLLRGFLA